MDDSQAVSPYPKFKGKTLDQIAATSEGLCYLDWLIGWLEQTRQLGPFTNHLKRYLARPEVSRAVSEALESHEYDSDDVPGAWHPPGVNKPFWER